MIWDDDPIRHIYVWVKFTDKIGSLVSWRMALSPAPRSPSQHMMWFQGNIFLRVSCLVLQETAELFRTQIPGQQRWHGKMMRDLQCRQRMLGWTSSCVLLISCTWTSCRISTSKTSCLPEIGRSTSSCKACWVKYLFTWMCHDESQAVICFWSCTPRASSN